MMDVNTSDPRIGSILNGRYKILDRIAAGGMAVVYKGERLELGRPVAIKFLQETMLQNPKFITRFEAEARAMSKLSHPYCVSVIDFGVEGAPYIVMDYVEGITLKALIAKERVSVARAITLARQILAGIAHAHSQGIVHRDVKPENIMLQEATGVGEQVRIFDFGLAKLMDTGPGVSLTHSSLVAGTPNYMSPEQSRGQKVDERTDLYSICVLFFELLTGQKPFIHEDFLEVVRMHRETVPPTLNDVSGEDVFSVELQALVARALAKDPEDRFQSAEEFTSALDATPEGQRAKEFEAAIRPDPKAKTLPVGTMTPFSHLELQKAFPSKPLTADDKTPADDILSGTAEVPPAPLRETAKTPAPLPIPPLPLPKQPEKKSRPMLFLLTMLLIGVAIMLFWPEAEERKEPKEKTRESVGDVVTSRGKGAAKSEAAAKTEALTSVLKNLAKKVVAPVVSDSAPNDSEAIADADEDAENEASDTKIADDEVLKSESLSASPEASEASLKVKNLADVKELVNQGKKDAAISGLQKLRREQPKNAYIVLSLANLYYEREWLADALEHYREAIRLEASYRKRGALIRNLIDMMSTEKLGRKAMYTLQKTVGRPAVPQLKRAAKKHKSALVRKRAQALLKKIRGR